MDCPGVHQATLRPHSFDQLRRCDECLIQLPNCKGPLLVTVTNRTLDSVAKNERVEDSFLPLLILLSHATIAIIFAIREVVVVIRVLRADASITVVAEVVRLRTELSRVRLLQTVIDVPTLTHQRITRETVIGAICGYLLIAILFSFAYAVLTFLNPAAISVNGHPIAEERVTNIEQHVTELMYFSIITLTTVGYGDIVPVAPMARSMVVLEALAGQLCLAAFVARLVGAMSKPDTHDVTTKRREEEQR